MYGNKSDGRNNNPLLEGDERYYFKKMKEILEAFPNKGPPSVISQLLPHLYIGSLRNAEDLAMLQRTGITHVLNVAGTRKFDLSKSPYPKEIGVKEFLMIPAEDHDDFNISQYFFESTAFINRAKRIGGKALVHCNLGVNRCAAICSAYLLAEERLPILEVVTYLKKKRAVVLCNKGFRRQVLRYAMARGLVEPIKKSAISSSSYSTASSSPSYSPNNYYNTLGTLSKYLTNRPRPEDASGTDTKRNKDRHETGANGNNVTNGYRSNGTSNGHVSNGINSEDDKENENNTNGSNNDRDEGTTMNGHSTEEDEEVAQLVDQPPRKSRFLPRNSLLYSPDPLDDGTSSSRPYSPTRPYSSELGSSASRPYSPQSYKATPEYRPYQRSFSADIEYQNRTLSPSYDNVSYATEESDNAAYVRVRTRAGAGRSTYRQKPQRPTTVCAGDYSGYSSRRSDYNNRSSGCHGNDDDLDTEYKPMINTFHLENLDTGMGSGKSSGMYVAMVFNSEGDHDSQDLETKTTPMNGYIHVKPYTPSLELVGRKYVSGSSTSLSVPSSSASSSGRYLPKNTRPHSVYTDTPSSSYSSYTSPGSSYIRRSNTPNDRPYSSAGSYSSSSDLSYSSGERSYGYKGYSPQINSPSDNIVIRGYATLPRSTFSSLSSSSRTTTPRGPISSAILRQSRNIFNSISDYNKSYDYL